MAAPILDSDAYFAKGTYHSFKLNSKGQFSGHHHPPGEALRVNDNSGVIDINRVYLEVREHNAPGNCRGFYCAARDTSFDDVPVGEDYDCTFVLVMGVSPDKDTSKMQIHYYKWKGDMSPYNSLTQAVEDNNHLRFAQKMFQPTLISVDYDAIHIKHLTQVSGPTFKDQPPFITANFTLKVLDEESGEYFEDDRKYHETGVCGDFVSNKGGCYVINKQQEKEKNMIRAPARTKNLVNIHSKTDCKDDVADAAGTHHITQFGHNSRAASNTRYVYCMSWYVLFFNTSFSSNTNVSMY